MVEVNWYTSRKAKQSRADYIPALPLAIEARRAANTGGPLDYLS